MLSSDIRFWSGCQHREDQDEEEGQLAKAAEGHRLRGLRAAARQAANDKGPARAERCRGWAGGRWSESASGLAAGGLAKRDAAAQAAAEGKGGAGTSQGQGAGHSGGLTGGSAADADLNLLKGIRDQRPRSDKTGRCHPHRQKTSAWKCCRTDDWSLRHISWINH